MIMMLVLSLMGMPFVCKYDAKQLSRSRSDGTTGDRAAIETYVEMVPVMAMLEKQFPVQVAVVNYHDIYEVSMGGRSGPSQTTDNNNCRAKGKGGGRGGGKQA